MIPAIPHTSTPQAGVPIVQFNPSQNVQAKASALTGEIVEVKAVQPVEKPTVLQTDSTQALRNNVIDTLDMTRSEILEKGSAFLSDPSWPPMTAVNAVSTIFIHDFFLNSGNGKA